MTKLLPCQTSLLLCPEYDSNCKTIDYICSKSRDGHSYITPLDCSEIETAEDIAYMQERVINSFIQQVCESCPHNHIQDK